MHSIMINAKVYDRFDLLRRHRLEQLDDFETPEEFLDHLLDLYLWNNGIQVKKENSEAV